MADNSKTPVTDSSSGALMTALRRILRPVIRLLLAKGVTYPNLIELLKSIFVDVADKEFRLEGKRQTDSRISLLTGVHRKDVKRLREEESADAPPSPVVSLGAQLVALWTTAPEYLDEKNLPRCLHKLERDGGALSFEALVKSVSTDIRSRVVLDEWLRLGVAEIDNENRVCLCTDAFVPNKSFEEKAFYFGQNLGDHISASAHNMLDGEPPFMDRSVYYDELSSESIAELNKMSQDLGMETLHKINRRAIELQERDKKKGDTRQRMNLGVYFFSTTEEDKEDS